MVENSEKSGFSANSKQIFAKYLLFYMRFYKGIKVNILATTQKIDVTLIYRINTLQITTITAENTKNCLNSVTNTIENIQFKNCEKLSPIVKLKLALFSSVTTIVAQTVYTALTLSINKAANNCSYIHSKGKHTNVLQTHASFSQTHTFMFLGASKHN